MTAVPGRPLTEDERSELLWLRKENTLLRVERDILLRVATGYAKDAADAKTEASP